MLKAIGADPSACGYTDAQVEHCLGRIVDRAVHQERPSAEQLGRMLWDKGLIAEPALGAISRVGAARSPETAL